MQTSCQEKRKQSRTISRPEPVNSQSQGEEPAGKNDGNIPPENAPEFFASFSFKKPGGNPRVAARASCRAEVMAPGTDKLPEEHNRQAAISKEYEG